MDFKLEPERYKPSRRYTTERVKNLRKTYESNISNNGFFIRCAVRVMSPRLEHYFKNEEVSYIEISETGTYVILNDSSRVLVK